MHIKFIRSGRSGQRAVAYLLKEREAEEVIVRRGEPAFFAALVDSLDYTHPYSSAVIAFAPQDKPTDEQIEEVIEGFKRTAWAGLEDDDFCILVVEHRRKDGRGTHMHFLIANYHIGRKKSYNPAPPGWQKRYDLLRNYLNSKYGWARPDNEKKAWKVQPGYLAFPGVAAEKRQVLSWVGLMVEKGMSLEEMAEAARASGVEVPRVGNDYLTLMWGKQRVRVRIGKKEKKEVEAVTIEEQKRRWQRALEKLAKENRERYGERDRKKGGKEHGGTRERITGTGHCVRGVQTRRGADPEPESGARGMVVLPPHVRVDVGGRPGGGIPGRMQRMGGARTRIRRITREGIRGEIRIRWAFDGSSRTAGSGNREPQRRSQELATPAGGVRVHDAARHGGAAPRAGGAAPAAGNSRPGVAGLWAAMEDLFRRLGEAFRRANTAARRLCAAAYRLVAVRGIRGMSVERQTGQAGQQPAARREEPKADVPRRDWPPWRQGPGWG